MANIGNFNFTMSKLVQINLAIRGITPTGLVDSMIALPNQLNYSNN